MKTKHTKYGFSESLDIQILESSAKDPLIRKALFVSEGQTKNKKRFYTKEALLAGAKKFVGAKMYLNHQDGAEAQTRPERSVEHDVAIIKSAEAVKGPKGEAQVVGEFEIYGSPTIEAAKVATWIDAKKKAGAPVELSLHGFLQASQGEADGYQCNYIHAIDSIDSVDFVTRGNTNAYVTESFVEEKESSVEELKAQLAEETDPEKKKEIQAQIDALSGKKKETVPKLESLEAIMRWEAETGKEYCEGGPGSGRRPEGGSEDKKWGTDKHNIDIMDRQEIVAHIRKDKDISEDTKTKLLSMLSGDNRYIPHDGTKSPVDKGLVNIAKAYNKIKGYESCESFEDIKLFELLTETEYCEGGPGSGRRPEGGGKGADANGNRPVKDTGEKHAILKDYGIDDVYTADFLDIEMNDDTETITVNGKEFAQDDEEGIKAHVKSIGESPVTSLDNKLTKMGSKYATGSRSAVTIPRRKESFESVLEHEKKNR